MTYTEAIEAAKSNKKVSRRGWGYFGWYHVTYYNNGTDYLVTISTR